MSTLNLLSFPDELILEVVTKLNLWKIDDFDPVAVLDLQRVSSVCRRLRKITLPVLFKHMVVDTKFLEKKDLKMYVLLSLTKDSADQSNVKDSLSLC